MIPKQRISLLLLVAGLGLWTLAPFGGCSCQNPYGPSSGPTLTPTLTHGPVVADFNDGSSGAISVYTNHWGGGTSASADTFGISSMYMSIIASAIPAVNAGNAFDMYGAFGSPHPAVAAVCGGAASTYPHSQIDFYLNPLNAGGQRT